MRGALVAVAANGVAGLPAGAEEVRMVVLRKVLARMERRPRGDDGPTRQVWPTNETAVALASPVDQKVCASTFAPGCLNAWWARWTRTLWSKHPEGNS